MGELLYGETIPSEQAAKLETFLNRPALARLKSRNAKGEAVPRRRRSKPVDDPTSTAEGSRSSADKTSENRQAPEGRAEECRPQEESSRKKPYKPDLASDEFKARVPRGRCTP